MDRLTRVGLPLEIMQHIFTFLVGQVQTDLWKKFIGKSQEEKERLMHSVLCPYENVLAAINLMRNVKYFISNDGDGGHKVWGSLWRRNFNATEQLLHAMLNGYVERSMDRVREGDLTGYEKNMLVRVARLILWKENGCSVSLNELIGPDQLFDYPEDDKLSKMLVDLEESLEKRFQYLCIEEERNDFFTLWIVKTFQLLIHFDSRLEIPQMGNDFILRLKGNVYHSEDMLSNVVLENILILDIEMDQLTDFNVKLPNLRLLIIRSSIIFEDYQSFHLPLLDHVNRENFSKLQYLELLNFPYFALTQVNNSGILKGLDSLRLDLDNANYFEDGSAELGILMQVSSLPKKSLIVDYHDFPDFDQATKFYSLTDEHKIFTAISSKIVQRRFKKRW